MHRLSGRSRPVHRCRRHRVLSSVRTAHSGSTASSAQRVRSDRPGRCGIASGERRGRIGVPAGTFNAIVVQPIIKTRGIFSEKGEAQVWLSDDPTRMLLQVKSKLSFGPLNMYLKSYTPPKTRAR